MVLANAISVVVDAEFAKLEEAAAAEDIEAAFSVVDADADADADADSKELREAVSTARVVVVVVCVMLGLEAVVPYPEPEAEPCVFPPPELPNTFGQSVLAP